MKLGPLALALAAVAALPAGAQTPSQAVLLQRTGAYVQMFVDNLTNVVAQEDYRQQFREGAGARRLTSDFLLVRYPGEDKLYLTFRDVLAVDGRPVRDQQERLMKLFLEPFDSAIRRAAEIQREGLTQSLPRGRLTDPLEVMAYLQAPYQENFEFSLRGYERDLGADVREVHAEQIVEPGTRVVPRRARAWISESSGRIVKTELLTGIGAGVRVTTTTFGLDPVLRVDVPLAMHDVVPLGADEFVGTARYSNFRRFEVRVEEAIETPLNPR